MTRICGILSLAAAVSLAGCASDSMATRDATSSQNDMNRPNNDYAANQAVNPPQINSGNDKTVSTVDTSANDRAFVTAALAGGLYEMQSGQIEVAKTSDDRMKTLAQHMIDDHTKANLQLTALANTKGIRNPVGLTTDQQNQIDQLNKLSGTDLDREYLRQQRIAHQDTISKFQWASDNADDRDVRAMASQLLPTLREHQTMIGQEENTLFGKTE